MKIAVKQAEKHNKVYARHPFKKNSISDATKKTATDGAVTVLMVRGECADYSQKMSHTLKSKLSFSRPNCTSSSLGFFSLSFSPMLTCNIVLQEVSNITAFCIGDIYVFFISLFKNSILLLSLFALTIEQPFCR